MPPPNQQFNPNQNQPPQVWICPECGSNVHHIVDPGYVHCVTPLCKHNVNNGTPFPQLSVHHDPSGGQSPPPNQ